MTKIYVISREFILPDGDKQELPLTCYCNDLEVSHLQILYTSCNVR